ncbi:MAG: sugar ABC transporter permease [Candidatus Rokuibacteriota bacterium]|nr:MAG: sugar ABC transporter permease [Candidatus Rokubacteria bacterium]
MSTARPRGWEPLIWLGPSLALIAAVIVVPAVQLARASLGQYSITGLYQGAVGARNYVRLVQQEALPAVVANTVVWVVTVVGVTLLLSLGLAQFLAKEFPGRALVRWALIVPWAASLIMTSKLFVWIYDYYFGILNHALLSLGVLDRPVDWLGDDRTVMGAMIAVGVFVSLPFTTYVLLAGLQSIPADVYEAARVDGASPWRVYRSVTVPLLRPALLVATALNIIYVFNSFPIVWTLNDRNPGFGHDTMITYMYKIAFKSALRDVGLAAALGVVNVLVTLAAVLVYLRAVRWREQDA